jgi:hypothetical protein
LAAECGIADEIGKEHCHLPAFALHIRQCMAWAGDTGSGLIPLGAQVPDRVKHFLAMTEEDAEALEIRFAQIGQNVAIDSVVTECLLVAFEAEAPQPSRNIQFCRPRLLLSAHMWAGTIQDAPVKAKNPQTQGLGDERCPFCLGHKKIRGS